MSQGNNLDAGDNKPAGSHSDGTQTAGHTSALHSDAYTPPLNHREMNADGTIKQGQCLAGPALSELTIDTIPGHVVVHDVPRQGATAEERHEAAKRDMPISNQHFRDLVAKGVDFMAENDGGFNIQMRNALNEANQSDKSMKTGHTHVDDLLKYANSHLCDTFYTLRRKGNTVEIYDTHETSKHPVGKWDLDKNNYVR